MVKVVARYADGRLLKGYSYDFSPGRMRFHLFTTRAAAGDPVPIGLAELKAVFFVRDFVGNARYQERKRFAGGDHAAGRRWLEVTFEDGEVLVGHTRGEIYDGENAYVRPGIFFTPADPASNNIGVYAVTAAVRCYRYLPRERPVRGPRTAVSSPRPPLSRRILAWLVTPLPVPRPGLLRRRS